MQIHHQSLRRLLYFQQIVESGSIRAAADRLGVSSPVVSDALSDLEYQLGVTLLARSTRRLSLTDQGARVFDNASQMVLHAAEAIEGAHLDADLEGSVAITVPGEVATALLPNVLHAFAERHPKVDLRVSVSDEVQNLLEGGFDLALRSEFFLGPLPPQHDTEGLLAILPLAFVSTSGANIAQENGAERKLDQTLLGSDYHLTHGVLGLDPQTGKRYSHLGQTNLAITNRQTALQLCRRGLGATLLIAATAQEYLETGELQHAVPSLDFGSITVRLIHRDAYPSPAARAFAAVAHEFCQRDAASI